MLVVAMLVVAMVAVVAVAVVARVLVVVVVVVGVLEVVAGGAQCLEDDGGGLGGQHGAELVVLVAGRAPGELAGGAGAGVTGVADAPVGLGEALELARGHRGGHLDQVGF